MRKFIFTYDAPTKSYEENNVRKEIILFLNSNGASNIEQPLKSVLLFDSDKRIEYWWNLITQKLAAKGKVLYGSHYLLSLVGRSDDGDRIEIEANPDLQDFVDEVLGEE